jgi:hypothetical protein
MSHDVQLILIGALISSFSTVLVALLNDYLKRKGEDRERKRQLEDRKRDQRETLLRTRIADVREYLASQFEVVIGMANYEQSVVSGRNVSIQQTYLDEIGKGLNSISRGNVSIMLLKDSELLALHTESHQLIVSEHERGLQLIRSVAEGGTIDKDAESERVREFYAKSNDFRLKMLTRLQEIADADG